MSRVTKLHKLYRRLGDAKVTRYLRGCAKSRRIRRAQGGKVCDWGSGHRTPIRGTWNVRGCSCGHKRHGKFGCTRGCAWSECSPGAFACPEPSLMLNPQFDDTMLALEGAIKAGRGGPFAFPVLALMGDVRNAYNSPRIQRILGESKILSLADSRFADLVEEELDKR